MWCRDRCKCHFLFFFLRLCRFLLHLLFIRYIIHSHQSAHVNISHIGKIGEIQKLHSAKSALIQIIKGLLHTVCTDMYIARHIDQLSGNTFRSSAEITIFLVFVLTLVFCFMIISHRLTGQFFIFIIISIIRHLHPPYFCFLSKTAIYIK